MAVRTPPGAMQVSERPAVISTLATESQADWDDDVFDLEESDEVVAVEDAASSFVIEDASNGHETRSLWKPVHEVNTDSSGFSQTVVSFDELIHPGSRSKSVVEVESTSDWLDEIVPVSEQTSTKRNIKQNNNVSTSQEVREPTAGQKLVTLGIWVLAIAGFLGLVWWLYLSGYLYGFGPLAHWIDVAVQWVQEMVGKFR